MDLSKFANVEAEDAILGIMMFDGSLTDEVFASVSEADFSVQSNKIIYSTIRTLAGLKRGVDPLTVTDELKKNLMLEKAGGHDKIMKLIAGVVSSTLLGDYCQIIRDRARIRRLLAAVMEVQGKALSGDFRSAKELIDFTESELFKVIGSDKTSDVTPIPQLMYNAIKSLEERFKSGGALLGISTGFPAIDQMTQGLKPGTINLIGARPSMGKTTLSLNFASNMALHQKKAVAYFSLEMPSEDLILKLLSMESRVSFEALSTGRIQDAQWPSIIQAAGLLSEARLYIDDSADVTPFDIRARCRRLKRDGNLDCIMIDYLGLIRSKVGKYESREREVAEVSATLKSLSKELKVPVLALAQLNREVEKRTGDPRPKISDLRDSGSLEQDADVIMLLFRPGYYDRDNHEIQHLAEIMLDKNRNGPTGKVVLNFKPELGRFVQA